MCADHPDDPGTRSEVEADPEPGPPEAGVIGCDNLLTIWRAVLDPAPIGQLDEGRRAALDKASR